MTSSLFITTAMSKFLSILVFVLKCGVINRVPYFDARFLTIAKTVTGD